MKQSKANSSKLYQPYFNHHYNANPNLNQQMFQKLGDNFSCQEGGSTGVWDPGIPAPRSTLQNRLAVFWEFRSLEIPVRPLVPNRSEVLLSIVGNFGEFQEFH